MNIYYGLIIFLPIIIVGITTNLSCAVILIVAQVTPDKSHFSKFTVICGPIGIRPRGPKLNYMTTRGGPFRLTVLMHYF